VAADVAAAVPSFLGLTVTLQLRGRPVTVTAIDADLAAFAGASLELSLGPLAGLLPGVLWSFTPAGRAPFSTWPVTPKTPTALTRLWSWTVT